MIYSTESEYALVGALLIDPEALDKASDLKPEHIYLSQCRAVYSMIRQMSATGKPIDILTVSQSLQDHGSEIEFSFLAELATNTPGSRNIRAYADRIIGKSIERSILAAAEEIRATINDDGDSKDKLTKAQGLIMGISESQATKQPKKLVDLLSETVENLQRRSEGISGGLQTGFEDIDDLLCLRPGNLVIVAGRPSMGKTMLSVQMAQNCPEPSLILSMEMSDQEIIDRLIASEGRVGLKHVIDGNLEGDEGARFMVGMS